MQVTAVDAERERARTPSPSRPRRCSCGGTIQAGGECAACRAKRERAAGATSSAPATKSNASSGFAPSRVPIQRRGAGHAPMHVSEPSDPSEREADRIAKHLFPLSPGPHREAPGRAGAIGATMPARSLQRASSGGAPSTAAALPGGTKDNGSPLPATTRNEMEGAFGADLSSVRVHTGSDAARSSRSLNARAYTHGEHIFFDQGNYNPESPAGKQLLAHELTHTIQQRDAVPTLDRDGGGRTKLQCVNENLSSAGVAGWLIGIVGITCGLIGALAGSPTGPGAAGTAAAAAAVCIAGLVGFSVGFVLGIITGCARDPNFKSAAANLASTAGEGGPGAGGAGAGAPGGDAGSGAPGSGAPASAAA